jgi:hypothetical protein
MRIGRASGDASRQCGHPQGVGDDPGGGKGGGFGKIGRHWLFSDMVDIDIQYAESGILSIDNIDKRCSTYRIAESV